MRKEHDGTASHFGCHCKGCQVYRGRKAQAAFIKQAQDADQIHTIRNDGTLADIERQCGVPLKPSTMPMWGGCSGERDSTEADAAQALFVGYGFSSQFIINMTGRRPAFTSCPSTLLIDMKVQANRSYGSVAGGKTAMIVGIAIHEELAKYCKSDIDAAFEGIQQIQQAAIRRLVAKAAFNLGKVAKTYLSRDERKAAKNGIKSNLANDLRAQGLSWVEVEKLISELVEGLKDV